MRNLSSVTGTMTSDHVLNLFEDLEGALPDDKAAMEDVNLRLQAAEKCRDFRITPENADMAIDELMRRFI